MWRFDLIILLVYRISGPINRVIDSRFIVFYISIYIHLFLLISLCRQQKFGWLLLIVFIYTGIYWYAILVYFLMKSKFEHIRIDHECGVCSV